jgi:hypothetical protein
MSFTFNSMNLKNVEVSENSILPEGNHIVEVTEAKSVTKPTGAVQIEVLMREVVDGKKTIKDWIVVHNPNYPKNAEIGLSNLKAMLIHGGHNNPDNPFPDDDVSVMKGLVFGVYVGTSEYNGKTSMKIKKYKSAKDVDGDFNLQAMRDPMGASVASATAQTKDNLDDDIPF